MSSMTSAEDFLATFNQLEQELYRLQDSTQHLGFKRLVDALSQSNSLVDLYKQDLIEFVELRNAIVHRSTGEPIAEPHPKVVEKLKHILSLFVNPPTADQIASKPVYTCRTTEPIAVLVKTMQEKFYSYVPVYNEETFVGVFSEHSLLKWMASRAQHEDFTLAEKKVGELQEFFDQADNKYNGFTFVSQVTSVFTVREAFTGFLSEEKRLGAVFVTKTGNPQEHIMGIITAWDLPHIRYTN